MGARDGEARPIEVLTLDKKAEKWYNYQIILRAT